MSVSSVPKRLFLHLPISKSKNLIYSTLTSLLSTWNLRTPFFWNAEWCLECHQSFRPLRRTNKCICGSAAFKSYGRVRTLTRGLKFALPEASHDVRRCYAYPHEVNSHEIARVQTQMQYYSSAFSREHGYSTNRTIGAWRARGYVKIIVIFSPTHYYWSSNCTQTDNCTTHHHHHQPS